MISRIVGRAVLHADAAATTVVDGRFIARQRLVRDELRRNEILASRTAA